jgi:hypothetical protein
MLFLDYISLAKNLKTPKILLKKLSQDDHYIIRDAVANNASTTPDILESMAQKEQDCWVKRTLAERKDGTEKMMLMLVYDDDEYVRELAACNLLKFMV